MSQIQRLLKREEINLLKYSPVYQVFWEGTGQTSVTQLLTQGLLSNVENWLEIMDCLSRLSGTGPLK